MTFRLSPDVEGGGRWARTDAQIDAGPPPRASLDAPVNPDGHTSYRVTAPSGEKLEAAYRRAVSRPADGMPAATRRILTALAQSGPRLTRRKLAIVTGYPPSGSSIRNNLSICRGSAWIADVGDDIEITPAGRKALGDFTPLPTGRALIDYWMRELPEAASKILTACIAAHPKPVTRVRLAELTGYPEGGSSIRNNLSKLRGLELVEDVGDDIKAVDELLQGARRG